MGGKVQTATLPKKLEDTKIRAPWYHFNEI